ncbi:hypothetical protein AB0O34_17515 [Sphaerisporangium sp. NPDC088356]|uniref:hypothetical protein n=1 Tax=Sphaerisporangium sp. NPDC088356 TaxID=3154871 RepID=UPI0034419518
MEERAPGQRPWSRAQDRRGPAHDPLFGPAPGTADPGHGANTPRPGANDPAYGTADPRLGTDPRLSTTDPRIGTADPRLGAGDPAFGAGGSFGGRQSPSRPFDDHERNPFKAPQAQGRAFEPSRGNPFEVRQQPPSRPFDVAQRASFEERGSDRPSAAETPPSSPPMEKRRREPEEPFRRRSRTPYFIAGGVVALIVAAGAGIVIMSGGDDPVSTAAPAGTRPAAQVPLVAGQGDNFTVSRKTDPQPLTLKEVFGHKKVTVKGRSYLMTVRRTEKKCKDAVHGTGMQKALTTGRCTQFLRASFRDAAGKLIGTVGVANLNTSSSAKKAAKAGTGGELEDYVTPLPGKDSATKLLGSGSDSYATAWAQGHYLVLLWFQYKDGHKPSKTELKALNRAAVDITEASVFSALDTRALTGSRSN